MVGLALSAETTVDAPPAAVFNLFGAGAGAGWVFDAVCDRVAVGAAGCGCSSRPAGHGRRTSG